MWHIPLLSEVTFPRSEGYGIGQDYNFPKFSRSYSSNILISEKVNRNS